MDNSEFYSFTIKDITIPGTTTSQDIYNDEEVENERNGEVIDFEEGESTNDEDIKKWGGNIIDPASELELNKFFEDSEGQTAEKKMIKCPFCGKEFEK